MKLLQFKNNWYEIEKMVRADDNIKANTLTVWFMFSAEPLVLPLNSPKALAMMAWLKKNSENIEPAAPPPA
mgnify:FL=1